MGSPMGKMENASTTLAPVVGTSNQNNFVQALMNTSMTRKEDGSFAFAPVAGYGGQLATDPNQTMLGGSGGVFNSWNSGLSNPLQQASLSLLGMGGNMGAGGPGNIASGTMNPYAGMQGFGGMNAGWANGPGQGGQGTYGQPGGGGYGFLSQLGDIANGKGAGASIDQTPAWQAMVDSQKRNIQAGSNSLAEQFNSGGGLFSTAHGSAQALYQDQAKLGQNAMLTQAQTGAMQQANQNQLTAAGQYGGLGTNLYSSNTGLGLQGLQGAGQLNIANLGMGSQLGGQQAGLQQNQYTSQYNNWLMQQPQNNPLLQMLYGQVNSYPGQQQMTYTPGWLPSVLGAAGGAAGMLSDRRLKENITHEGKVNGINIYSYNFKGLPGRQTGVIAQELYKTHPEAVYKGDRNTPWMVNKAAVQQLLTA